MKISAGINMLNSKNLKKKISKKITLANTNERVIDEKALKKAESFSNDPFYIKGDSQLTMFNPDIRFRPDFSYSPINGINYRNDLLLFAENDEVKDAVDIIANETVIMESDMNRYPVFPEINHLIIEDDKKDVANAIQDYLDKVFYPKLFKWYNFKEEGLIEVVREFLITGKLAYEIIYDSLTNPKEIIGLQPLDPTTIQKFRADNNTYFVQRGIGGVGGNQGERILHENQIILIEWNEYDFGYISYVDRLRRPFNIMRAMLTSKVLWFAAKSQVRMHIKFALGDISRNDAMEKLSKAKEEYQSQYSFTDDGQVLFNNKPNNIGYREIFTAETAQSGQPEIEEVNSNGPDLSETDSLSYWEKLYWKATKIPYDRIDPNSSETWGFADVNNLRKIEVNFGKYINKIRKLLNPLFLKPIIIQLTLKEVEIGVDLNLLDSIKMKWIAFNQYEQMAELEVLNKRVELAQNLSSFADYTDAQDKNRKAIPLAWIVKQFMDFSQEQLDSMEVERRKENVMLGFNPDGSEKEEPEEEEEDDFSDEDFADDEPTDEDLEEETSDDPNSITNLVKSGEISQEELKQMIEEDELTSEEIDELKNAGLYPEEEIHKEDDNNFE